MASGLNTSPRGSGWTIFPGMLVSLLQSVILSIIILFAADFPGISCSKAHHLIQTPSPATRPKFVEQDNQVVDLEQERQAASIRITHQHLDNEEHSVQPDQRNKISGDDWDPQSRLVWASPAVVHSDVNISPSNKMGTAIQQHEPENQKVDAAMESVSSVPSPLINVKAKHNLGIMAMTRATTEQTPGVESTEMRHYLDQSSPVTERDIDNLEADGYLISESGWIRKFTTTEMPAVDADILKTTQTDAKQNYTYIHVEYQIPADLKKCNRCVCHTQHTGSKVVVIADCKHKHFRKMDVPQNLPHYTYSLDLTSNDLQLRTFEAFSKYPFLINLLLDHNSIGSLEYTPQFIHPTITNLSLKYNNITQIKDFSFSSLPFLKTLYLSHNHLLQITRSTFASLSNLRQLDLSHNELIHIEPQAFYQCVNLDLLDLNQNFKLTYGTETLNNDLFSPLKKLRFLRIAGFQSSETSYPGFALAELISLEQLTLDGLKNVVLGPSVGALKKLSSLFIGDNGSCLLDSLTAYFFKNLSFLKELYIYFCPLTCLSADMYVNIPLIERLVFDRIHYGFDEFFSHLRGLTNSSVKELTLKGLLSHIGDPPLSVPNSATCAAYS